jgi:hypothetical protein
MTVLGKAIDTTIRSEEAQPLFDKAAARFQEIIAMGYVQWSQVHTHKAHRWAQTRGRGGRGGRGRGGGREGGILVAAFRNVLQP